MKNQHWPDLKTPVAEIIPNIRTIHGDTVIDNYYWMIDYFKKGPNSSKAVAYLDAENQYQEKLMSGTKSLQTSLFNEMKARIKEVDESVPVYHNGYFYYTRTEEGKEYAKYCRKKGDLTAQEEILLDIDEMASGQPYYSVIGYNISPDNKLLAFGVDNVSRRQYTIFIKNLETGALCPDIIINTEGDPVWAADSATLFYTEKNPITLLSEKIRRHRLGENMTEDPVVYEEKDKSNYIGLEKSKSGQFIMINSTATQSSAVQIINANLPETAFRDFQTRIKDVLYSVIPLSDKFLILTNWQAKNFRLMECPLDQTEIENWKEVIPHRQDVLLEEVDVFKDYFVIAERKDGLSHLRIMDLKTKADHYIVFEEPSYTAAITANPEFESKSLRYIYTSMTTPLSTIDYDMEIRTKELMKQMEIVGGYNSKEYTTERIYATARDGVRVPISIVYKKGFKKTGNTPLLLYAYGSYGYSIDASFSINRLSLLDRGFAFAIAHIRGGQDLGRHWYDEGKLMKKMNTFTDFIDCAEYLIAQNYSSKNHLYAQGGSAGGLLMGAVVNLRPDLWRGVIAQVPFVDVVNTMLDESIPLTTNEFDEWGNPKEKAAYDYMKAYSPYENVEKKDYPNLLVMTGLHDSQVQYFEPAKWVAKLRANKTDKNVLLFKTDMDFGHSGASGRFDYLKDIAFSFSFLLKLEGINA